MLSLNRTAHWHPASSPRPFPLQDIAKSTRHGLNRMASKPLRASSPSDQATVTVSLGELQTPPVSLIPEHGGSKARVAKLRAEREAAAAHLRELDFK